MMISELIANVISFYFTTNTVISVLYNKKIFY